MMAMSGCEGPNDAPGQGYIIPPPLPAFDIPYDLHPLRTAVSSSFIRGADISNCWQIEQHGGVYRNFDNYVEDIMKILTDNGINYARLRLWVDPDKHWDRHTGDGDNNLAVTTAIAVRAKNEGMKFLLNFHYSDLWADPSHQHIPWAWKDIPTKQGLLDALYAYTKETLEELIEAGAEPDMVQLGNEISGGLLFEHAGYEGGSGYVLNGWQDYSDALQTAARAVREAAPNAKIMVHIGEGGSGELAAIFSNFTGRVNGQGPTYNEVDYDIMGLSWYTFWPAHQSIDSLYSNIQNLKQTFGKDVVVCETGYLWTVENFDDMGNYAGTPQEDSAANLLTNANGFASDSGVKFAQRTNGTKYLPASPENQARVIRATMDAVAAAGGLGVMWWGADWFAPVQGLKSNAEMGTLFDNFGMALPALKVLGGIRGADAAAPGAITGLTAAAVTVTAALNWDTVNSAIASKYQVERAQAISSARAAGLAQAAETWTVVSDTLTGGSYADPGLAENTTYYYRVRACNANGWGAYCDPVEVTTAGFTAEAPANLRVIAGTAYSITLQWTAVVGAASYKLYGVNADSVPAASAYAELYSGPNAAYTHNGLTPNDTWWYKASAVYSGRGEGPASTAVSAIVGAALDFTASINMSSAALDPDFLDPLKGSGSTNYLPVVKTDNSNYQIEALYAANDADYLYIALDYGSTRPAMWQYDWITVWIDNAVSAGGGAAVNNGSYRIAKNQTLIPVGESAATIEAAVSQRQNTISTTPGAPAGTSAAKNTTWTNTGGNLWAPSIGQTVIKYRIPLANMSLPGDELRILAAHTQGWSNGSDPRVGGLVPANAVTGAAVDSDTVTVTMANALSYTVK